MNVDQAKTGEGIVKKDSEKEQETLPIFQTEEKELDIKIPILARLVTNDGIFLERRRPQPKKLPSEVIRFITRPPRRGLKLEK